jgi:hypothetical protein
MRTGTTSHRRRIVIALGCAALVFMLELAEPLAGHAQTSSRDRLPLELWKTYPLVPRTGEARLRLDFQSDQLQVPLPGSGDAPAGRTGPVGGRLSASGEGSSASPALPILALSLAGLIVMVLVARRAVSRHESGSLARFGSAVVSPIRSFGPVPRPKLGFQARTGAGAGLGRSVGRAARLPLHFGAHVGAALRSAAVVIFSKRGKILFYAVVAVASVGVGIGVNMFLSGG